MTHSTVWNDCLNNISEHISSQHFATWFKPIRSVSLHDDTLELTVPNRFFLEWVKEHYVLLIKDVLRKSAHKEMELNFTIKKEQANKKLTANKTKEILEEKNIGLFKEDEVKKAIIENQPKIIKKTITGIKSLNKKYTFDTFVIGKANEFAHAACMAVTKKAKTNYNPLFIYGDVGLGKTHLLHAIGNTLAQKGEKNICYYTSENFMNEFISFVSRNKMVDFRKKFRKVDVLLIDDIQFWSGKERTQEEFFHTFNTLYENEKQIVVTSDKFPKDIQGIEERLRSRFEWGLVADIQSPDVETKIAILNKKAMEENITLLPEVTNWLANLNITNVRELEGFLNRVVAVSSLTGKELNLETAKDALKNLTREIGDKVLTIEEIMKVVATQYGIKVSDIKSKRRHKTIALPRQIAMYIAREYGEFSYPEIGSNFGGKDHSTVIHAYKKIKNEFDKNIELNRTIRVLLKDLGIRK